MTTQPGGLGRVPSYDPRNEAFRIRAVATPLEAVERRFRYWWNHGHHEDQGATPHCTAAAALHWREDGPITTRGPAAISRVDLYRRIQATDRAEGRHYDEGATSLALAKTIRGLGWCGEFRWGYSLDELVQAVLTMGPVLIGSNWYRGMSEPDAQGFIVPRGTYQGGHEYLVNGVSLTHEVFRIKNSWGRSWGKDGHARIRFQDMAQLIAEEGDVLLVRELPEARTP